MFEKKKDSPTEESGAGARRGPSYPPTSTDTFNTRSTAVIGETIKIKGEITGDENLVIEGRVQGSVKLSGHDLTVGQKGQVDADLSAKNIKVEGRITGDITGSEKVTITQAGSVLGNIVAPRVTLEDGAKFKGSIDMDPGGESAQLTGKEASVSTTSGDSAGKRPAVIGKSEPAESKGAKSTG